MGHLRAGRRDAWVGTYLLVALRCWLLVAPRPRTHTLHWMQRDRSRLFEDETRRRSIDARGICLLVPNMQMGKDDEDRVD